MDMDKIAVRRIMELESQNRELKVTADRRAAETRAAYRENQALRAQLRYFEGRRLGSGI